MKNKYLMTKQEIDGRVFIVWIKTDKELSDHVSACFELTDCKIISIVLIGG